MARRPSRTAASHGAALGKTRSPPRQRSSGRPSFRLAADMVAMATMSATRNPSVRAWLDRLTPPTQASRYLRRQAKGDCPQSARDALTSIRAHSRPKAPKTARAASGYVLDALAPVSRTDRRLGRLYRLDNTKPRPKSPSHPARSMAATPLRIREHGMAAARTPSRALAASFLMAVLLVFSDIAGPPFVFRAWACASSLCV